MKINKDIDLNYKQLKIKNNSKLNKDSESKKIKSVKQDNLKELLIEGYKKQGLNLAEWESTVSDNWD